MFPKGTAGPWKKSKEGHYAAKSGGSQLGAGVVSRPAQRTLDPPGSCGRKPFEKERKRRKGVKPLF